MLYNEDLEKAILYFMVFDNYSCDLTEKDFSTPQNVEIINAIKNLRDKKQEINMISIQHEIQPNNHNILTYLMSLESYQIGITADYAYDKITELTKKRKIYDLLAQTLSNFENANIDEMISKINKIEERKTYDKSFLEQVSDTLMDIENNWKKRNDFSLYTGITDLDNKTCGLHNQELTIIGARPGVGKTTLALQIAEHIAKKGLNVAFISLEMASSQIIQKILAKETRINSYKMRMGTLEDEDWETLAKACGEIAHLPINLITNATTIQKIEMETRRLKNKNKLDLLIIDYLQLIKNTQKFNSREQEVADITRTLKLLSLELEIPIIALCQLNRNASTKEPSLADLRESGAIEQDADNVIFLYQEQESQESIIDITLKLAKQRAGEVGKVYLKFKKNNSEFVGVLR